MFSIYTTWQVFYWIVAITQIIKNDFLRISIVAMKQTWVSLATKLHETTKTPLQPQGNKAKTRQIWGIW